jgi:hypothetical protein
VGRAVGDASLLQQLLVITRNLRDQVEKSPSQTINVVQAMLHEKYVFPARQVCAAGAALPVAVRLLILVTELAIQVRAASEGAERHGMHRRHAIHVVRWRHSNAYLYYIYIFCVI